MVSAYSLSNEFEKIVIRRRRSSKPAHHSVREEARIHRLEVFVDDRTEGHLRADIAFDIHARSDFDQVQTIFLEREDRAFGDVADIETAFESDLAAER